MSSKVQKHKDQLLLVVLTVHFAIVLVWSLLAGHFHVAGLAGLAWLAAGLVVGWKSGSLLSRLVLGLSLMAFSGLFIHLSDGLIEMHFHVFVGLALLSIYYDWRVISLSGLAITVHHIYGLLFPVYHVYAPNPNMGIFLLHLLFIVLECAVLCYQGWVFSRSINNINLSSRILVESDLTRLTSSLQQLTSGSFEGQIELKTTLLPVLAWDELGDLTRLYNKVVQSCHSIGAEINLMVQSLKLLKVRNQENVEHILRLCERVAYSGGGQYSQIKLSSVPTASLKEQIETTSGQIVLAAMQLDGLQRQLEHRLIEQSQLNEQHKTLLNVKDRFFASLSHELRTPLTAILGYSELLNLKLADKVPESDLASIRQITQSAINMRQMINDILDYSKMEAGKLNIIPEKTDLAESIGKALREVEVLTQNKNLIISQNLSSNEAALADPRWLHQILLNLLSNSIKFTPSGGAIRFNTFKLKYSPEQGWRQLNGPAWDYQQVFPALQPRVGRWIAFQVSDTGQGIAASQLPQVFDEFEQLEDRLSRGNGGTGLGLAIVRNLSGLMGGQVVVESEPGSGTTFTVLLPAWQSAEQPQLSENNPAFQSQVAYS